MLGIVVKTSHSEDRISWGNPPGTTDNPKNGWALRRTCGTLRFDELHTEGLWQTSNQASDRPLDKQ
jgi:hypothetical protein